MAIKPGWFSIQEDDLGHLYVVPEDLYHDFCRWSEAVLAGVECNVDSSKFIRLEGDDVGLIVFQSFEVR